jgi:G3E family GTPase
MIGYEVKSYDEGLGMKTTIVCGLLGSGKTTFIRSFVKHRIEKTVVLVNDFGAAGIDGEIFSAGGIESVELPSGCVCCTLKFDLITTIQRIVKQFAPEHLLIEPSGVASPSGVLEALESVGVSSASVIGIVDVAEFAELYESGMYGTFFKDQIENSDVILVNKTDLADETDIVAAERLIISINPRAILFRTQNAELTRPLPDAERLEVRGKIQGPYGKLPFKSQEHFRFQTMSFRINCKPALADFTTFFDDLAKGRFGSVARAKSLVDTLEGPYRFDSTYGKVDSVRFEKSIEKSRLVVIGEGLENEAVLQKMASSCASLLPWKELL